MINNGERLAILVGQGARGAAAEVRELAELTGAGVAKALPGKDVLPDDLPYVTGAKFAHPDRPVIALVGDGTMQMNGTAELITALRCHPQWTDRRCAVCVFHDNDLNQVIWTMRSARMGWSCWTFGVILMCRRFRRMPRSSR